MDISNEAPRIARSDAIRRWHQAIHYEWQEGADRCGVCPNVFTTGQVIVAWGDILTVAGRCAWTCLGCMLVALQEGGELRPSALMVFVEERHRNQELEQLPGEIEKAVFDGFRIIDAVAAGVSDAAVEAVSEAGS